MLTLAAETARSALGSAKRPFDLIAGVCGRTPQARREARLARARGFHAALLSSGAWMRDPEAAVLRYCRAIATEIPLIGFYLQTAVGGREFSYRFWRARKFCSSSRSRSRRSTAIARSTW